MSIIVNGVELTEVIYAGVNLDTVKVKKGAAEAVTVFEKITQLATPQNVTADGTNVSWDAVENATSYAVLADGSEIGTVEGAVTDLTGTTWVFNDTVNLITQKVWIDFIDLNKKQFNGISPSGVTMYYGFLDDKGEQDGLMAYDTSGWLNPAYKAITITGGIDATNSALISWLESSATQQTVSPKVSVDLTTLPGWSPLSGGTHNIAVVAKADGYRDSEPSAAVSVEKAATMPVKGDIITLDSKQYRVLKTEGTVAEVLCMYDANSSIKFDSASSGYNNTYAGKSIDTYCNNTFYSGLSAAMKAAIVDKTFMQDSWDFGYSAPTASHYTGKDKSNTKYYLTLANAAFGTSITRHCYCLSIQDVLDYLEVTTSMGIDDTTLTATNVWRMFWNTTTSQKTIIWSRSAKNLDSRTVVEFSGYIGGFGGSWVDDSRAARPAFQIDLSKVEWTK